MAGIAYKEEIISYGSDTEITLNYTGDLEDSNELDWSQAFYQRFSVLLCKVYNSTLILDQLFFALPSSDAFSIHSIEHNKRIRIRFPGKIIPQICLCSDPQSFTLFVATAIGHIYKLTFLQDQGFTENCNVKDVGGYMLENLNPRCFALVSISSDDYEVCLGLETGPICFATLPMPLTNEYIFPSKTRIVEINANFIKKVKAFVCSRPVQERVLRVANLKDRQMLALSNFGVVRLYNTDRISLLREIDLEVGLVQEFKFAYFVKNKDKFVAIGLPDGTTWWILIIKILSASFEVSGKFTEKGFLVDLGVDAQGVWSAWIDDNKGKIVFKPFQPSGSGGVFSFDDQILAENLEDDAITNKKPQVKEVVSRILAPGRFTKQIIEDALNTTINLSLADLNQLENYSLSEVLNVLNYAKMKNWKNSQILALACSDELGHFPVFVIRGVDRVGVMRSVNGQIDSPSLYIKKSAIDWNPLNRVSHPESLAYFRLACNASKLSKCLIVLHTWRQNLKLSPEGNIKNQLDKIVNKPMSDALFHLLKRTLPTNINEQVRQAFKMFELYCTSHNNTQSKPYSAYISRFSLTLLGSSLISTLQAFKDYFIDLSLFLLLCGKTLKPVLLHEIDLGLVRNSLNITEFLWALTNTLSSPFNQATCKTDWSTLNQFAFRPSVSPLYINARSEFLIAKSELFSIENCNLWILNTMNLALQDLLTISEGFVGRNYALMNVLVEYGQIERITDWYKQLDCLDAPGWYFTAKALIAEGKTSQAQHLLIRASTDCMSSNPEANKEKLFNGPWLVQPENSFMSQNIFNLINSAICKSLENSQKKGIILADFIISTLYADFCPQKIEKTVEDLTRCLLFSEAFTVLQCNNRKIVKKTVCDLIEKAVESGKFAEFLCLPLLGCTKDMIHNFLLKKAANEHFDLFRTITHEDYYDQALNLFSSQYPREDRKKQFGLSWTLAFYSYSMRNLRFASAAEASYKIMKEIENHLAIAHKLPVKEKEFLTQLAEDYLVLTTLAARSINKDKSKCWFRVAETLQKTRKLDKEESMKLVTLPELEAYFART